MQKFLPEIVYKIQFQIHPEYVKSINIPTVLGTIRENKVFQRYYFGFVKRAYLSQL